MPFVTRLLLIAAVCGLVSPAAAQDRPPPELAVRAPPRVTDEAERLLAEVAAPTTIRVDPGENPIEVARRVCGTLSPNFIRLFANANGRGDFAIRDEQRFLQLPACFVVRTDQTRAPLHNETLREFALRNTGWWSARTGELLVRNNRDELKDNGFRTESWTASSRVPVEAELHLNVTPQTAVYQFRDPATAADSLRRLNEVLQVGGAEQEQPARYSEDLVLESNIPASTPVRRSDCSTLPSPRAWPLDYDGIVRAIARNRRARAAQGLPPAQVTTIAVIDNGIEPIPTTHFPSALFYRSGAEVVDGRDNDDNRYVDDDAVGVVVFERRQQRRPDAIAELQDGMHGTHIAALTLGGPSLITRADELDLPLQLLIISIVTTERTANGVSYIMPTLNLTEALDYATRRDASILNLSVSTRNELGQWAERLRYDYNRLLVVAAGNAGINYQRDISYPAQLGGRLGAARSQVVTVAAHDENLCLTPNSGRGSNAVDIAAPGVNIDSYALNNTSISLNGTSQATAFVTFAAALLRSEGLSASAIKYRIWAGADLSPNLLNLVASDGALNVIKTISRHHDVLEREGAPGLVFGRLDPQVNMATWCPARAERGDANGRVLKVSRPVDERPPGQVRLLVRWQQPDPEVIYCTPTVTSVDFRDEAGTLTTVPISQIVDLVMHD